MDPISIAAGSVDLSLAQTQLSASTSVLKDAMNFEQDSALNLIQSLNPNIGQNLDISA